MHSIEGPVLGTYGVWNVAGPCNRQKKQNIGFNVCGYLPVVSVVSGLARVFFGIILAADGDSLEQRKQGRSWIVRGALEVCQMGVVLLVFDAFLSSLRTCQNRKTVAVA
jgi:hypothetical protein